MDPATLVIVTALIEQIGPVLGRLLLSWIFEDAVRGSTETADALAKIMPSLAQRLASDKALVAVRDFIAVQRLTRPPQQ